MFSIEALHFISSCFSRWHYRNAVRHDGQPEGENRVYHPGCHADYKNRLASGHRGGGLSALTAAAAAAASADDSSSVANESMDESESESAPANVKEEPMGQDDGGEATAPAAGEQSQEEATSPQGKEEPMDAETEASEAHESEAAPAVQVKEEPAEEAAPVSTEEITEETDVATSAEVKEESKEGSKDDAAAATAGKHDAGDKKVDKEGEGNGVKKEDEEAEETPAADASADELLELKDESAIHAKVAPVETEQEEKKTISINITTKVQNLNHLPILFLPSHLFPFKVHRTFERRQSVLSTQSAEDSFATAASSSGDPDLDKDGIVQEATRDWEALKPKMAGKAWTVFPPKQKDHDESSLCAIM